MVHSYARSLMENKTVEDFLNYVLNYDFSGNESIISEIVQNEILLYTMDSRMPTINHTTYRDHNYRTEAKRWQLRKKIIEELFSNKRIMDEDLISLGNGGSLPLTHIQNNRTAVIITGLPASGKSSISNKIADYIGGIILDSDYAKRKLPEYKNFYVGATILHEESDAIVFGFKNTDTSIFKSLFEECLGNGINMVIPKIGHNFEKILTFAQGLKSQYNYKVHLVLVSLERKDATLRALKRFIQTKRYVPLSLIFDAYSNDPILSYYRIKNNHKFSFASIGKISTKDPVIRFKVIEYYKDSPVKIFEDK